MHCTTASIVPFMWEDMTNYVGQREIFFYNCGPQNEPYLLERKKMTNWYEGVSKSSQTGPIDYNVCT